MLCRALLGAKLHVYKLVGALAVRMPRLFMFRVVNEDNVIAKPKGRLDESNQVKTSE